MKQEGYRLVAGNLYYLSPVMQPQEARMLEV